MSSMTDLPEWVWQLVEAVEKFEDEHPILYRRGDNYGEFERTDCLSPYIDSVIPYPVREAAKVYRQRQAANTPREPAS